MHEVVAISSKRMIERMRLLGRIEDREQVSFKASIIITWNQRRRRVLIMTFELTTRQYNAFILELLGLETDLEQT
jgi:hypothetical protein